MSANTTPANFNYAGGNDFLEGLIWGGQWVSVSEPLVIEYTLKSGRDPYGINGINNAQSWNSAESSAMKGALSAWASVADISFSQVSTGADLWFWKGKAFEVGALAWQEVPVDGAAEPLYGAYAYNGVGWNSDGLKRGGFAFSTILHELGHALGLAHPHDSGGVSTPFPGVTEEFGDYGDDGQNQGVYTVMSYNDGWTEQYPSHSPYNQPGYGYAKTPMALDIAAIQLIYGANMSYRTGDDVYKLPSANKNGVGWACIWDAGGVDTISIAGASRASVINLNDAPLTGPDAGGYISYGVSIKGGYTIANGVVIENATGGKKSDTITGNEFGNDLKGAKGADIIEGQGGDDRLWGGGGNDELHGDAGADVLEGGGGADDLWGGSDGVTDVFVFRKTADSNVGALLRDTVRDFELGIDQVDLSQIDAISKSSADDAFTLIGTDVFSKTAGELRFEQRTGFTLLQGDVNGDGKVDFEIDFVGTLTFTTDDLLL